MARKKKFKDMLHVGGEIERANAPRSYELLPEADRPLVRAACAAFALRFAYAVALDLGDDEGVEFIESQMVKAIRWPAP